MGMWIAGVLCIIIVVAGGCIFLKRKGKRVKKWLAVLMALAGVILYSSLIIPKVVFPAVEPLAVTGLNEVETVTYTWTDEERVETYTETGENRSVTVKFWYPKEDGSYPLVVFSHGAFGIIDSNYSTCMELASHGYVVASIGHPYHAMFVEEVNGEVKMADMDFVKKIFFAQNTDVENYDPAVEEEIYAHSQEWMAVRVGDENFVLDTILEKVAAGEAGPFAMVDAEKIGLFGHSMGGAASVQVGRERTDIDAVIDLEGTMFGEYAGLKEGIYSFCDEPYPIPLLDVNSRAVYEAAGKLPFGQNYVNFHTVENAVDSHYVIFEGAGHLNFTDLPVVSPFLAGLLGVGEVDARACIENVNEMVLQFFNYYLKDDMSATWQSVY